MTVNEILPKFQNIYFVKCNHTEARYTKISEWKTQYTYRFMYVASGFLDVCIDGETERVKQGDILYIIPGDFYRLIPLKSDFAVYNIFFDISLMPNGFEVDKKWCIFKEEYKEELCSPKAVFSDAHYLNKSRIFRNDICKNIIENIIHADKSSEFYEFFVSSEIRSLFAQALSSKPLARYEQSTVTDKIIEYIRLNYDKDISAKSISEKFSYHPNYINKLIRQKTGKSLSSFIRYIRIGYAIGLLYENDMSLLEISSILGYYDYSHFYKAFVAETGLAPTEYKLKN